MIRYRIAMLAYAASPEIRLMTQAAIERVLSSTGDDARVTVGINGGASFPVKADPRLAIAYWEERKGLGEAYNSLVLHQEEPFVVFLHNDCFVPTDKSWLEKLAAAAAVFGFGFPMVRDNPEEFLLRGLTPAYEGCPPSCCYVVRRDVFGRLGGFDAAYKGCHFEDLDLFMRACELGCTMARVREVEVFHHRGMTRSATVDDSNAAFQRNKETYQGRWGRLPTVQDVGLRELLGEEHGRPSIGENQATGPDGSPAK